MAVSVDVDVKINLNELALNIAEEVQDRVALVAQRQAKLFARVDTGALRQSIFKMRVGGEVVIGTILPYGRAQEFGLGNNYGFTPYMRPAARVATRAAVSGPLLIAAAKDGFRRSLS